MEKVSSGIRDLDGLLDSFHIGDNVVWEVEAGTLYEVFVESFAEGSFSEGRDIIYVSFNKSPQSILQRLGEVPGQGFTLLDCFTAGKGKNDKAFQRFYEESSEKNVVKVGRPGDIMAFTDMLNSIEDSHHRGVRYVFDSLTGMQDLWGGEEGTYKFFTYMCPRLYDLGTVAYWILEKDAHSQQFKANLRHITQVVLDLYKRKDNLYIKALRLDGRQNREAFRPHLYRVEGKSVFISPAKKDIAFDIGTKIRQARTERGMSQRELADKVDLTPSFISQLENNQISPSLSSFIQICNALGISPDAVLKDMRAEEPKWLIRRQRLLSGMSKEEGRTRGINIVKNGKTSGSVYVIEPGAFLQKHFSRHEGKELIFVLKGFLYVEIAGRGEKLSEGDSVCLTGERPTLWRNEKEQEAEVLVVSF